MGDRCLWLFVIFRRSRREARAEAAEFSCLVGGRGGKAGRTQLGQIREPDLTGVEGTDQGRVEKRATP